MIGKIRKPSFETKASVRNLIKLEKIIELTNENMGNGFKPVEANPK